MIYNCNYNGYRSGYIINRIINNILCNNRKGINSMSILTFENIVVIIIVFSVLLAIVTAVFNIPKILSLIFIIIPIILLLVVVSSEELLKNTVPTESRTEILEVTSKSVSEESVAVAEYKDLECNIKKTFISGVKTSDEDISYSYIETKTYRIGFLYKDVNTLYLKK